ncbi:sugar nucleotide-binding protein [Streptococcus sp. FT1-55]|uniref:sugar nucleotide-binding protein n=1 Tax=Streptococcus sp. FT1-55 TaxID=3409805 RepID=UPI003BF5CCFE
MILVTGANGQLGTELRYLLDERNEDYVAVDVAEMDITDADKVEEVFSQVKPTLVYHCAAYTAVDAAEDEGKELNYAINVTGTENVAKAAAKYGATLVYISTDPPYTPEMNPIEQVWAEIRKLGFKNKVFKTLNEVIDKLEEVIQTLTAYQLKSIVHRDWTSAIFDFN